MRAIEMAPRQPVESHAITARDRAQQFRIAIHLLHRLQASRPDTRC
jgi:hypothetical protein